MFGKSTDETRLLREVAQAHPRFVQLLAHALEQEKTRLIHTVAEDQLRRAQGRAQCLADLVNAFEHSLNGPHQR